MTDAPELHGDAAIRDVLEGADLGDAIKEPILTDIAQLGYLTAERARRIIYKGKQDGHTSTDIVNSLIRHGSHPVGEPEPDGSTGPCTLEDARREAGERMAGMAREKHQHEQEKIRAVDLVRTLKANGTLQGYVKRVALQSRRPGLVKVDPEESYTLRMTILGMYQADKEDLPARPAAWV